MAQLAVGQWEAVDVRDTLEGFPRVIGGDLAPGTVLAAYQRGFFPLPTDSAEVAAENAVLYEEGAAAGKIALMPTEHPLGPWALTWWHPAERPALDVGSIRLSRDTRRVLRRQHDWTTTANAAFEEVVAACGDGRAHRWITTELAATLLELHRAGWAHSVEVWDGATLIGGIFGVAAGTVFSADSTFHRRNNAGKVAFADLGARLAATPCRLIDLQWPQHYLPSLGARWLDRDQFLAQLADVDVPVVLPADRLPVGRLAARRR